MALHDRPPDRLSWLLALAAAIAALAISTTAAADDQAPLAAWQLELRDAMRATPDAAHGEDLYAPCGACHGVDGRGVSDGSVPAVAAQHYTVVVKQLVDYRYQRRWDMQMEHAAQMRHLRGGQDLADLGAFIAGLPRGFSAGVGTGESLDVGVRAYFERCESCHGPLGGGNAALGYPRLAGQHYGYLYRQFFDAIEQRRPSMEAAHVRLMAPLGREQITGISDYLSRTSIELTRGVR
jgi:cytochrome c553